MTKSSHNIRHQYLSEQTTRLDGNRSQLQFPIENISNSINVWNVGLFLLVADDFTISKAIKRDIVDRK